MVLDMVVGRGRSLQDAAIRVFQDPAAKSKVARIVATQREESVSKTPFVP
jgi:hypothetical protein